MCRLGDPVVGFYTPPMATIPHGHGGCLAQVDLSAKSVTSYTEVAILKVAKVSIDVYFFLLGAHLQILLPDGKNLDEKCRKVHGWGAARLRCIPGQGNPELSAICR